MAHRHAYPPELAAWVVEHWPAATPLRYARGVLADVLSTCYQASLTVEEGRPTRFRLLLTDPARLPELGAPKTGVLKLAFDAPRPFTSEELRRLSPATPFETTLIGAHAPRGGHPSIWGVAHSGPAWLAPSWGGREQVPIWTTDPIIHVTGPGRLAVRCAGHLVGGLERGVLADTTIDVFDAEWLGKLFAPTRALILAEHAARNPEAAQFDPMLIRRVAQHMLRRMIQLVRNARHGGMILFAEPDADLEARAIRFKFKFAAAEPRRRFRSLMQELLTLVGESSSGDRRPSWDDFAHRDDPAASRLEGAIFELSRLIAALAATDGAVVLDKRFELLGFAAEVAAVLPTPSRVWQALDVEGTRRRLDPIESVGTRHRAAYRFVRDHPGGCAIVISHDGAVRFVASVDGEVVFWEQSVSP